MKQEPNWQETPPTESGWYWHHDGDAMRPVFVFPRPGHKYMAVQDEPNEMTGKRQFRMVERMRGHWMEIAIPTLPPARPVPANA